MSKLAKVNFNSKNKLTELLSEIKKINNIDTIQLEHLDKIIKEIDSTKTEKEIEAKNTKILFTSSVLLGLLTSVLLSSIFDITKSINLTEKNINLIHFQMFTSFISIL